MYDLLDPLAWILGTLGAVTALLVVLVRIDLVPTEDTAGTAAGVPVADPAGADVEADAVPIAA